LKQRRPNKYQALEVIRDRGVPIRTILDVGVLYGTPELVKTFPGCHHELFEPVAEFRERIHAAYAHVSYRLNEVAVGDFDGSVDLKLVSNLSNMTISHSSMVFGPARDPATIRSVPATRIDSFVAREKIEGPFLLKVDIDGHELRVLAGAKGVLDQCSVVIVECVHNELAQRIQFLQAAGFRLYDLTEPCYYDGSFWQCDAVFLRRDVHEAFFSQLTGQVDRSLYQIFTD
jgi:FkbM family methyltransferase